jgi:Short C-terminal domain
MDRLQQLAQLHSQGVLSDEEFAAAKAKVLGI